MDMGMDGHPGVQVGVQVGGAWDWHDVALVLMPVPPRMEGVDTDVVPVETDK
jgi:hypothetical protein